MVTPLLRAPRTEGGTLYTFPSAQRDLARVFANDSYTFKFSRFACLDFPDIMPLNYGGSESGKFVDLTNSFPDIEWENKDVNCLLAEHFQNYIMNFETAILNGEGDDDGYDNDILRTPAERIFFNWLQKVGGIEFEYAGRESNLYYERCGNLSYDPINLESHSDYVSARTVKYIGDIDIINSVEIGGDAYNEVYLHIPSTVGASYEVRFAAVNDGNYDGGNCTLSGNEYIIGWDSSKGETTPNDLSPYAIYDYDNPDDEGNSEGLSNTYVGDNGYIIDFRDSFYTNGTVGYGDIMTMNDMSPDDFEFNCVLIYYDFTNNTTGETVTNLYGVLFLEEVMSEGSGSSVRHHIQCYPKHKTTNLSDGNSFGLKVDIKIDAYPTSDGETAAYKDTNRELLDTFQEYMDDMVKLQKTIDIFNRQQAEISRLEGRVHELETLLYGIDSVKSMESRLNTVETRLDGSGLTDQYALTELISDINDKVDMFVSEHNGISTIVGGYGIDVTNEQSGNRISISSSLSKYSINLMSEYGGEEREITKDSPFEVHYQDPNQELKVYTGLEPGSNLAVLYVADGGACTNNLDIYIDDTNVGWKKGQTFRLRILDFIDLDGFWLNIHTGYDNGVWMQTISIPSDEVSYTPDIEIVCVDDVMVQSSPSFIWSQSSPVQGTTGTSSGPSGGVSDDFVNSVSQMVDEIFNE